MIYYVKGKIESIMENKVIIENGGIGYEIQLSDSNIGKLPPTKTDIMIYTYFQARDDGVSLYGFLTKEELDIFNLLITVTGIGPRSALNMLNDGSPKELMLAIVSEDKKTLSTYKGVGPKTAARIILELKDKIATEDIVSSDIDVIETAKMDNGKNDAVEALVSLGYSRGEAFKAVLSIWEENMAVEEIIRRSLRAFSEQ